ncbi:MAG: TIGR03546 family protein [Treponema sp.]|nr:TIGR03546 family protein [Treponema sp.]
MFKGIAKLLLALNGNVKKSQIALGFCWGHLLGIIPIGNIFWLVLFFISFFFRHNHAAKLASMAFFLILSSLLAYQIDAFGWFILTDIEALQPLFISMYNMPFVPFTNFNNTLVMGGLAVGMLLWFPLFLSLMAFIPFFRDNISPRIRNSKVVEVILKFPLFSSIDKAMKG